MRKLVSLFFVLVFFFSSCSKWGAGNYVSTKVEVSQSIEKALHSDSFVKGSWPSKSWWLLLEDPQLSKLIEYSLENNPSMKTAKYRVDLAKAQEKQVRSSLFPKLNTQFNYEYANAAWIDKGLSQAAKSLPETILPNNINFLNPALTLDYDFDLFGKNYGLYQGSKDLSFAKKLEEVQSRLLLSVSVANTYFNLQKQLKHFYFLEKIISLKKETLSLTALKRMHALANEIDEVNITNEIFEYDNKLSELKENIYLLKNELKLLMGLSPDSSYEIKDPSISYDFVFPLPDDIPIALVSRRADIMAKVFQIESMGKSLKVSKMSYLPNINLKALTGYIFLNWDQLLQPQGWLTLLSPSVGLPIFKGFKIKADIKEKEAKFNILVSEYENTILKAAKEIAEHLSQIESINSQIDKEEVILENFEKITQLNDSLFENGLGNKISVIKSKETYYFNEIAMMELKERKLIAMLSLIKSLGGGYEYKEEVKG